MTFLTLAEFTWRSLAVGGGVVGFLFVCLLLILTVLIQRPQGGGLAGAFGSAAGSGQTAFGAKTGDALTIFTIAMFVIYLLAAIGLNFAIRPVIAADQAPVAQADPAPSSAPASNTQMIPMQAVPGAGGKMQLEPMDPAKAGPPPTIKSTPIPAGAQPSGTTPNGAKPAEMPASGTPTPAPAAPAPAPAPTGDKPAEPKPDQPK